MFNLWTILHPGRRRALSAFSTALGFSLLLLLSAQAAPPVQDRPDDGLLGPIDVRLEGSVTQPALVIGGRTVFDGEGVHLGRPQPSPDGRQVAVEVIPTGTETAYLAQIYLYSADGELIDQLSGHSPQWIDSSRLRFETTSARGFYDTSSRRVSVESVVAATPPTLAADQWPVQYPETVRVAHHPSNGCRNVAPWQIDTIPIEEYVARSVPAESPVSWSIEALKAQAVAARTYAWYKIRLGPASTPEEFGKQPYDVTDWANYQMMCDSRFPRSDQAVAETSGQYLSARNDPGHAPIIAMYSAQNSHPTRDNPAVTYLRGVPDLFGLGRALYGHGYGLSQWGAKARAEAGHNYRQILGHYYTGVYLQNATDPAQPLGGLLGLEPNGYLPPGGVRWNTLAPALPLPLQINIAAAAPLLLNGRSGVWRNLLDAPEGTPIQVSLAVSGLQQDVVTLQLDRTPPSAPSLNAPESAETHRATVQVITAADEQAGLRNDWLWQAEAFSSTVGMDNTIADALADQSTARLAQVGVQTPGYWYGPYTTAIPAGSTYRALFRLRIAGSAASRSEAIQTDRPLARLDVTDHFGDLRLGLRDLWLSDFPLDDGYAEIAVDFYIFEPPTGLEFRVQWFGEVDLAFDRIQVYRLIDGGVQNVSWPLTVGTNSPSVTAVSFDRAGNVSAPVSQTIRVTDENPPTFLSLNWPQGWQTQLPITLTATVQDLGSGLAVNSGRLHVGDQSHVAALSDPADAWAVQQLGIELSEVPEGEHVVRFEVADQLGQVRFSEEGQLRVDVTRPVPSIRALDLNGASVSAVDGWLAGPIQVEVSGEDSTSGLNGLAYVLDGQPFVLYSEPFLVDGEGSHRVRYWAEDKAGNYSLSHFFDFGIDNSGPAVNVTVVGADESAVQVEWLGQDAYSGVAGYTVETRFEGGAWQPVTLADPLTTSASFASAEVDEIRVRAVDGVGHVGEWTTRSAVPLNERLYLPHLVR